VTTALDLSALETEVERALATGDESALHVLGYGEITTVLAWPYADGPWACKRLPPFDDPTRLDAYCELFDDYVTELSKAGVRVHETEVRRVPKLDGRIAAYCVQSTIAPELLAPAILRRATAEEGERLLAGIFDEIVGVVSPRVGLDGQLSNWAVHDDTLVYFDLTTPLLRDDDGRDRLDTELFLASLPAPFRVVVRRFLLDSILDPYYDARLTAQDVLSNLHKEGLHGWIPAGLELANARLERPLTMRDIDGHYHRDARLWTWLQRFRRVDRQWQRRVRRRPYPFLLPGRIDRHRP
jgi:hypothetical protein